MYKTFLPKIRGGLITLTALSVVFTGWGLLRPQDVPQFSYPGHPFSFQKNHAMALEGPDFMVESDAPALQIDPGSNLSTTGWTATASSSQPTAPASNIVDGKLDTIWHSQSSPAVAYPHTMTIDMKRVNTISRVAYVPRQSGLNGQVGRYRVYTSLNGTTWGAAVSQGTWADSTSTAAKPKQFAGFPNIAARYVKLEMLSEAGGRMPYASISELDIYGAADNFMAVPRTDWKMTADSIRETYKPQNLIDNNPATIWHSATGAPAPHWVQVDMGRSRTLRALSYLPRYDTTTNNGVIGGYKVQLSTDAITWTTAATGTWADDKTEKVAIFTPKAARYVRISALTEAGNRGNWSSGSELNLYDMTAELPMLSRADWTANATSEYSSTTSAYSAAKIIDGNSRTHWVSGTGLTLPQSVTIDMKTSQNVTGLSYIPRTDATPNGTIGGYKIETSVDGIKWVLGATGNWPDNKAYKTVRIPEVTTRYIRLSSLREAGNRGLWAAGSEVYVLGNDVPVGVGGQWSPVIGFPLVPTSGALLPNNKLLVFSGYSNIAFDQRNDTVTKIAILDLATGIVSQPPDVNTNHQMFCTGLSLLADGRLLITGGSGDSETTIYNPFNNTWTKGPAMKIGRGYQSSVTLSDGKVFMLGGSFADLTRDLVKTGELYTPNATTGSWNLLSGVSPVSTYTQDPAGTARSDNHVWLFAGSNGTVFHAGPSSQMHWITTSGNGTITSAGLRGTSPDSMNGNAAMYDVGKILTVGGSLVYDDIPNTKSTQAHREANLIDISGGINTAPTVTPVSPMKYRRALANSIVLPTGDVLVMGGQQRSEIFTDTAASTTPELWSPLTRTFRTLTAESIPRTYHSLALLLPDGRVFSGGGGLCGSCVTNHTDGQIYTPPYLLNSNGTARNRPTITTAPATLTRGSSINVTTSGDTPQFSLVRTSSVTHSVNTDQRRISLTPVASTGSTYTLSLPSDSGTLVPGYYMLFAINSSGTPSVSKIVKVP